MPWTNMVTAKIEESGAMVECAFEMNEAKTAGCDES